MLSLTETPRLRERLQKYLAENDVEKVLFEGCPEKFAERVWTLREAQRCREEEAAE